MSPLVNLFYNYYIDDNRQEELDRCLEKNREIFDSVILIEGRPTFSELFERSKSFPNDINCFCNSDIYFTDLSLVRTIKDNECFAITRDDLRRTNYAPGSQDAWCFKGVIKPIAGNFTMGMWGCDNRIAHEIKSAGYALSNPAVHLVHLHAIDNRDYKRTKENTVPPPYQLIHPE